MSEIFFYKVFWVRDYQSWKPKSYNNQRQFASLLRHLFAKYDVPSFMDEAWMPPIKKPKFQEWFIHIGSGENIRTAHQLPCPLTKKEAHYFLQAPDNCAIRDAFRYGQIMSLGGDMRVFRAFMGTKVASSYENNEFVLSLLRFFIANPMLDTAQYGPIVDYIWNQKYNSERTVQRDTGAIEIKPPSQPNFSMTGRSVDALLKHVEEWHKKLGKEQKSGNNTWLHSKVKDYEYIEGKEGTKSFKIWKIYELLSSSELVKEGREMSHCVSSYASSCMHGRSSIFTMIMESYAGKEKCVTIEVTGGRIIQIRGKRNRVPTVQENSVLSRWAQVEGLSRSQYLR